MQSAPPNSVAHTHPSAVQFPRRLQFPGHLAASTEQSSPTRPTAHWHLPSMQAPNSGLVQLFGQDTVRCNDNKSNPPFFSSSRTSQNPYIRCNRPCRIPFRTRSGRLRKLHEHTRDIHGPSSLHQCSRHCIGTWSRHRRLPELRFEYKFHSHCSGWGNRLANNRCHVFHTSKRTWRVLACRGSTVRFRSSPSRSELLQNFFKKTHRAADQPSSQVDHTIFAICAVPIRIAHAGVALQRSVAAANER